jgi:hypothetical protein
MRSFVSNIPLPVDLGRGGFAAWLSRFCGRRVLLY